MLHSTLECLYHNSELNQWIIDHLEYMKKDQQPLFMFIEKSQISNAYQYLQLSRVV